MGVNDHLRIEHFSEVVRRPGVANLARRTLEHVVALCPECHRQWGQLRKLQPAYLACLDEIDVAEPLAAEPPLDDLDASPDAIAAHEASSGELQRLHRQAHREMWTLLRLPRAQRAGKIRGAYRRFRSRLLAEMLIAECRTRVRNDPGEALAIAELVPLVLRWASGSHAPDWARGLLALAVALRGNALRIGGDLLAAEQVFTGLRAELTGRPLRSPRVLGDLWSLEASVRNDLRQMAEAERLLVLAAMAFELGGDRRGLARVRIKQANLIQIAGRPSEIVPLLDEADWLSRPRSRRPPPPLHHRRARQCAHRPRPACACELPARSSLRYASSNARTPSPRGFFRFLQGRVALGLGRYQEAVDCFTASRDAMVSLGRTYDADLGTLFLAEAHRAAGHWKRVERLATDLVPAFRARGVVPETRRALELSGRGTP